VTSGGDTPRQRDPELETLWELLLDYIGEGSVLPVVGRDLLTVRLPGPNGEPEETLLYSAIARDLAASLDVTVCPEVFDGANPLGAVASAYILRGGNYDKIYRALPGVVDGIDERRAPGASDALRQLAEIEPFKVFLTTTFDPLLARCVDQVRQTTSEVLRYWPEDDSELVAFRVDRGLDNPRMGGRDQTGADLRRALKSLPAPVVVHLLGQLSRRPNYVVTEEDAFEFVYSLQETRPEGLFNLLAQMKLLIVGCRFPHWLVRFFLRTARRQRLLQTATGRTDFLVDPTAGEDASLVQFLRDFRTQTEVFTAYTAMEFVDELSRRWHERVQRTTDPTSDPLTPHSIFISYASENQDAAQQVAAAIHTRGLPVWLDRGRLGSGDQWSHKIRRNIEAAGAFVPLLSRASLSKEGREFRREWRHAYEVIKGLPREPAFIYPIVLDDVPRNSSEIDQELRDLHWETHAPGNGLAESLIVRLRTAYRAAITRSIPG
jgi:hypothetical protein